MMDRTPDCSKVLFEKAGRLWARVTIKPQSRREGLLGLHGDSLRVGVKAAPVEGKANAALILVLAELFDCARSQITIEQGHSSRNKLVSLGDLDKSRVLGILERLLRCT